MSPPRARRLPPSRSPDWLGLSEASEVLGVSPATLRRWADAGRVRSFTTPGGHRRFARRTLERFLPAARGHRPPVAVMGVTPERVTSVYRRSNRVASQRLPWVVALPDADRDAFRELGRGVAVHLLGYLDAETPEGREDQLREAKVHAA
ncbi:MAG: helix-turn-helix domain-containing protein, partial [Chloroflexi bacterium]|nr:helix-turn-helix domain-containing protein [Chloroflexota bacterium]